MSSNGFERDFEWQRQFLPEIKPMLGSALFSEAPIEEDRRHNTDMMVLAVDPVRVACRVRRAAYLNRYPGDFTIRCQRPRAQTELAKVLDGWGDYIFYGIADGDTSHLAVAVLGDLNAFRDWWRGEIEKTGAEPGILKDNGDGTKFRAFAIDKLPAGFVVYRKMLGQPWQLPKIVVRGSIPRVTPPVEEHEHLLDEPGCIRAQWWAVCRGCDRRIEAGDIVRFGYREGRRHWLCVSCALVPEPAA